MLKKECDRNIQKTIELADAMILLARQGNEAREDSSCGVLYGTLLDAGFKLKQLAAKEKEAHKNKGEWQQAAAPKTGARREGRARLQEGKYEKTDY